MASSRFVLADAKAKLTYLARQFGQRNTDFQRRDHIYDMEHEEAFWGDEKRTEDATRDQLIQTSVPVKAVNTIVGMFTQNPPRFVVSPMKEKPTKKQQETTGEIERFLQGVWQENEARYRQVRARVVKSGSVRGWGALKTSWNEDRERVDDAEAEDVETGCPIEIKAVDARYLYPESGGVVEDWQSVMYAVGQRRTEVERQWDKTIDKGEKRGPHDNQEDVVEVVDYWWWQKGDYQYHGKNRNGWYVSNAVWAEDTLLKKPAPMPAYCHLPYIVWLVQPGYQTEPEHWGMGHLGAAEDAIKNTDRVMSRWFRMLTFSAEGAGWLQQTQDDADEWAGDQVMTIEPGLFKALPKGWQAQPAIQSFAYALAQSLFETFYRDLQDITMPLIASGRLPGGDTNMAGVTMQGIMDAAATWLAPDVESYATMMANASALVLSLASYYSPDNKLLVGYRSGAGKRATTKYVSLTGSDLDGYRVDVAVDTENSAEKMRKAQLGIQMAGAPPESRILSMRTIRETLLDVDDPDEEEFKLDQEEVWGSEQFKTYRMELAARHLGLPEPPPEPNPSLLPPQSGGQPMMPGPQQGGPPPGLLPGQMGVGPSGPMQGPPPGPPPGMVSPQEMGGSPMPMPVPPGMPMMGPGGPGG